MATLAILIGKQNTPSANIHTLDGGILVRKLNSAAFVLLVSFHWNYSKLSNQKANFDENTDVSFCFIAALCIARKEF